MAPELALVTLEGLPKGSTVLDPMVGSGTVVRQALRFGHDAVGYDLDPLAVLMSRAWTTPVADEDIEAELGEVLRAVAGFGDDVPTLDWQRDCETVRFVDYWFHDAQRRDLARIAFVLHDRGSDGPRPGREAALDVLRVAFSRIIITKEQGASLARDTSHSRPHRVATTSDYRVVPNFERSVAQLRRRLLEHPPEGTANVGRGDARALSLRDASVDAVVTSPPYLNAIDYMRGHRMSLVWLGHAVADLRRVRSTSIGAERSADHHGRRSEVDAVAIAMRGGEPLGSRLEGVVERYALDLLDMTAEVCRVLKTGGRATFVMGNSCIKGRFVDNANGLAHAAERAGMVVDGSHVRDLPAASRYLPVSGESLSKRMRTETVLACSKPN